jgi:hypothetical protein
LTGIQDHIFLQCHTTVQRSLTKSS